MLRSREALRILSLHRDSERREGWRGGFCGKQQHDASLRCSVVKKRCRHGPAV